MIIYCITKIDWASIATLLTALATFLTVFEMKKQREQARLPNLVFLPNKRFYLYKGISFDNIHYWYWHETIIKEDNLIETIKHLYFEIEILNIGVENAKTISFNYEIDTLGMKSFLEHLGNISIDQLLLNQNSPLFSAKLGDEPLGMSASKEDMNFSYIVIPKTIDKPVKVKLPQIYLCLFDAYILSELLKNNRFKDFNNFPTLKLVVLYQDIANKKYKKEFMISITIDSVTINTDRAPSHLSGLIKIDEIIE